MVVIYVFFFAVSRMNRKRGRGKYKSKTIDIKTKYGGKFKICIPDDIDRAVGSGARDIINYSGLIMRSTISFRDGNWKKIVSKYGEAMWYRVKLINHFQYCIAFKLPNLSNLLLPNLKLVTGCKSIGSKSL